MIFLQEIISLSASTIKNKFDYFIGKELSGSNTKTEELYRGILEGRITDDKTACIILYGDATKVNSTTYNSLKMRFFWRIANTLFFLDPQRAFVSKYNRVQYECWKNSTIVRILMLNNAHSSAEYVAKRTLTIATKHHFSAEASVCSNALALRYSFSGQQSLFEKYAEIAENWSNACSKEDQSDLYYFRVVSWYAAQWSLQQENLVQIANYISEIDLWRKKYDTNKLHQNFYRLERIYAEIEQNYSRIIMLADEVQSFFKKNPHFYSRQALGAYLIAAMSAHIWCRQFAQAFKLAVQCETILSSGSNNWFYFQEPHIILALRSKRYDLAKRIFRDVITNPNFNKGNNVMLEKWRLLEFYIRFITNTEIKETLLPNEHLRSRSKYKHYRAFSATLPTLARDITGYNIVGVFAQILYLLRIRDFDALIIRDESLQAFRRKRLNKLNYRLAIFSKLIHIMVESGFELKKIEKRSVLWLRKLSNIPQKFKGGTAETLEIIPLEDLWQMMIAELRKVIV